MATSHDFARRLLALPEKPLYITYGSGWDSEDVKIENDTKIEECEHDGDNVY